MATPEFKERLRTMDVQIAGGTSADAAKLARYTYARNQQLVKELRIVVQWAAGPEGPPS